MQFASDRTDLVKRIEHLGKRKSTQGMTNLEENLEEHIRKQSQKLTQGKFRLETRPFSFDTFFRANKNVSSIA